MYTIKTIEKKLSREQYKDWLKAEPNIEVPETAGRFDKLQKFLLEERRRVEKLVRRSEDNTKEPPPKDPGKKAPPSGSYGAQHDRQGDGGQQQRRGNKKQCLVHVNGNHTEMSDVSRENSGAES